MASSIGSNRVPEGVTGKELSPQTGSPAGPAALPKEAKAAEKGSPGGFLNKMARKVFGDSPPSVGPRIGASLARTAANIAAPKPALARPQQGAAPSTVHHVELSQEQMRARHKQILNDLRSVLDEQNPREFNTKMQAFINTYYSEDIKLGGLLAADESNVILDSLAESYLLPEKKGQQLMSKGDLWPSQIDNLKLALVTIEGAIIRYWLVQEKKQAREQKAAPTAEAAKPAAPQGPPAPAAAKAGVPTQAAAPTAPAPMPQQAPPLAPARPASPPTPSSTPSSESNPMQKRIEEYAKIFNECTSIVTTADPATQLRKAQELKQKYVLAIASALNQDEKDDLKALNLEEYQGKNLDPGKILKAVGIIQNAMQRNVIELTLQQPKAAKPFQPQPSAATKPAAPQGPPVPAAAKAGVPAQAAAPTAPASKPPPARPTSPLPQPTKEPEIPETVESSKETYILKGAFAALGKVETYHLTPEQINQLGNIALELLNKANNTPDLKKAADEIFPALLTHRHNKALDLSNEASSTKLNFEDMKIKLQEIVSSATGVRPSKPSNLGGAPPEPAKAAAAAGKPTAAQAAPPPPQQASKPPPARPTSPLSQPKGDLKIPEPVESPKETSTLTGAFAALGKIEVKTFNNPPWGEVTTYHFSPDQTNQLGNIALNLLNGANNLADLQNASGQIYDALRFLNSLEAGELSHKTSSGNLTFDERKKTLQDIVSRATGARPLEPSNLGGTPPEPAKAAAAGAKPSAAQAAPGTKMSFEEFDAALRKGTNWFGEGDPSQTDLEGKSYMVRQSSSPDAYGVYVPVQGGGSLAIRINKQEFQNRVGGMTNPQDVRMAVLQFYIERAGPPELRAILMKLNDEEIAEATKGLSDENRKAFLENLFSTNDPSLMARVARATKPK